MKIKQLEHKLISKPQFMKILILCTGNSCRSQMAHGFMQSFNKNLTVASAGTEASGKLNAKAVKAMAEIGIDISGHTSDSRSEERRVGRECRSRGATYY